MRKTMKISYVAVLTAIVLMGLMVSVSPAQMVSTNGGKQLGYNPNLCAGCGGLLHGGYCNSCEFYSESFADCGTGNCAVRSTDCGIGSAVRDVVHVALTPVYWVASLLSMGAYSDCGCAAPVRRAYCDPCDQCTNWVGCDSCGGVGCNSCGSTTGSFSGGMTTMGGISYSNANQGEVIYYGDNPTPTRYQQPPANSAPPKIIDTETSNPPQTYYRPNPSQPNQQNRNVSQQNFNGNNRQQTNVTAQTPQYIFVTPNGDVVPPEKVKGFSGQTDETTFEIAPMPMPQPIRPVSYEKPKASPLDFLAKKPNTATQPSGNSPRYGK